MTIFGLYTNIWMSYTIIGLISLVSESDHDLNM